MRKTAIILLMGTMLTGCMVPRIEFVERRPLGERRELRAQYRDSHARYLARKTARCCCESRRDDR